MQAYQNYRSTAVNQADPVRLVGLLYDGALRNCLLAQAALRGEPAPQAGAGGSQSASSSGNAAAAAAARLSAAREPGRPAYEEAHNAILKAYAIVAELAATLDNENGGEIALQLERLYDYILHLLREADMSKSERPLREAQGLLEGLSRTWNEAFPAGLASVPEELRGRVGHKRRESLSPGGAAAIGDEPGHIDSPGVNAGAEEEEALAGALDLTG